jgi:prepilin-type N-terminal cleavage/methylation domain-containing protein
MEKSSKLGFSLIELSIVILVIGILVIGITKGSRIIQEAKIKSARSLTLSSPIVSTAELVLWLDTTSSESFNNLPSDGDVINSWNDIKKQSPAIVTVSDAPTYLKNGIGGLPVLSFNGSSNYISVDSIANSIKNSNELSLFVVANSLNNSSGAAVYSNILVSMHTSGNGNVLRLGVVPGQSTNGGRIYFNNGTLADNQSYSTVGGFYNSPHIFTFVENKFSAGQIFADGTLISLQAALSNQNYTTGNPAKFSIGQEHDASPSDFFQGYIGEVVVFNRAVKASERSAIESYLKAKWSIK